MRTLLLAMLALTLTLSAYDSEIELVILKESPNKTTVIHGEVFETGTGQVFEYLSEERKTALEKAVIEMDVRILNVVFNKDSNTEQCGYAGSTYDSIIETLDKGLVYKIMDDISVCGIHFNKSEVINKEVWDSTVPKDQDIILHMIEHHKDMYEVTNVNGTTGYYGIFGYEIVTK